MLRAEFTWVDACGEGGSRMPAAEAVRAVGDPEARREAEGEGEDGTATGDGDGARRFQPSRASDGRIHRGPGWHAEFFSVRIKLRQNLRCHVTERWSLCSAHLETWIHLISRFGRAMRIRPQFLDRRKDRSGSSAVSLLVSSNGTRGWRLLCLLESGK